MYVCMCIVALNSMPNVRTYVLYMYIHICIYNHCKLEDISKYICKPDRNVISFIKICSIVVVRPNLFCITGNIN